MIVFVEDNIHYAKGLINKLKKNGFTEIKHFSNIDGFTFIEADIYIIDLQIQTKQSFEIIKEIKQKTKKPILLLTGSKCSSKIEIAFNCGVDFYIDKLIYPNILIKQIESIIKIFNK